MRGGGRGGGGYIGETKKKRVLTQSIEHQDDSTSGKWETYGATEHSKDCHGWFNLLQLKMLAKLPNIDDRKIRESLEISNLERQFLVQIILYFSNSFSSFV